jgi:hypothetical protein
MHRLEIVLPPVVTRELINLALLVIGFGTIVLYMICTDTCSGVSGTLAGIDLNLVGLLYLPAIGVCLLRNWKLPTGLMLASGVGGEVYLVGYQVYTGEYCPYCLTFGAVVVALCVVNFQRSQLRSQLIALPLGFLILLFSFAAAPLPSFGAGSSSLPVFGSGPVEIRLYTDYFCEPCSRLEPELEDKLVALVENGRARVVFIDVPLHPPTPIYAGYFLAMLKPEEGIREALRERGLLFAAAGQDLQSPESLEAFLRQAGCEVAGADKDGNFSFFNQLLAEDAIRSTPTLVVREKGRSESHQGYSKVLKEIDRLSKAGS